jgi:3-phosphoshikimate 1-carboxyvinyltransferase
LKGGTSSQYLSSILLCAPYFEQDTEIKIIGDLASKPYIDMTLEVMNKFGVHVVNKSYKIFKIKAGQKYQARDYKIEPDASAASYFIAGAALTGQRVRFPGLRLDTRQGDIGFIEIVNQAQSLKLKAKNHNVKRKARDLLFQGVGKLQAVEVDMNSMPDMVPTLAVLAMFAKGKTVIKNVANLRIKETDRLKALATEIKKFGIRVREFNDGIEIVGNPNLPITNYQLPITTYNDHRIAMAFAVAKLLIPDIIIENRECVAKSFPRFWEEWGKLEYGI